MPVDDADEFVPFQDVRVIRATAQALFCRIAQRCAWLPRGHIVGKLFRSGDRGKLSVRRWVARDRHLIDLQGMAIPSPALSLARPRSPAHLYLVRRDRTAHRGH